MTERTLHTDVRSMLLANTPFDYCHLIKFERPSRPDSTTGKVSTSAVRYTYLTDASRNVSFDDSSTDLSGASNGTQTYLANKVLKVSSITEEVEARASTFNLLLDGTGIGASVTATCTTTVPSTGVYDIAWPSTVDLLDLGFREGDKVTLAGISAPGDYNIHSFRTGNVLRLTKIDTTLVAEASVSVTMTLASEEVKSILIDKNTSGYSSFLNREVWIWKAFFNESGTIVGSPVLIFKGLISNVGFNDTEKGIEVSWGLTSHWGDWAQVNGRITSDDFHRALDENGNPNPLSTLKPIYAYDKGFAHAETSINLLATYSVKVEKMKVKAKNGFFGIGSKVKVKKYFEDEARTSGLDFQLQAKSIPVHYGVRPVQGIPIFADTLYADSSTVYVAYALGEGEMGAIYDVYIDGNSLICANQSDYDARSTQTADNTVPLVCKGRADRGDVLGASSATSGSGTSYYSGSSYMLDFGDNILAEYTYISYVEPAEAAATQIGVTDGQTLVLSSPQEIAIDYFSGKEAQKAAQSLVNLAASNSFKVQRDYWQGTDTPEYWGPNHRLLDTAYVVAKFKIKEGETTIPDLEFIMKGKMINCYNYDYSYSQYTKATGESASNFKLGQYVLLYDSAGTTVLNGFTGTATVTNGSPTITVTAVTGGSIVVGQQISGTNIPTGTKIKAFGTGTGGTGTYIMSANATPGSGSVTITCRLQIIDKWTLRKADGSADVRFRFSETPNLGYSSGIPSTTKFLMRNASLQDWTMITYNFIENSGAPQTEIKSTISSASNSGGKVRFTTAAQTYFPIGGDPQDITIAATAGAPKFSIVSSAMEPITVDKFASAIFTGATTTTTVTTYYDYTTMGALATAAATGSTVLVSRNTIRLASGASSTDDYYNGMEITLTRTNSTTGKQITQTKTILDYVGASRIATIEGVWDITCIPTTTDTYSITQRGADSRCSTNFAMISADYATSTTYGRRLNIFNDMDFSSILSAARDCDERSDVTVRLNSGSAPTAGDVYKWTNTAGDILWQGTVLSSFTSTITGSTVTYVTFTDCLGKLSNLWNSWKTYAEGELVYWGSNLYKANGSYTPITTAPTHTGGTTSSNLIHQNAAPTLSLVYGSGSSTLSIYYTGQPIQSVSSGRISSGYSLYDSDGIDYWRYIGWEGREQRYVTKHQGNVSIDTSQTVFDNQNSILAHFGGILRYNNGKYSLSVETTADAITTDGPYDITSADIVGKISLQDEGIRSSYNSLAVSYADPSNKFEARNISFFNSDYLKADRNVARKGSLSIPGITNYYNARLLADKYLKRSRFGLNISLTLAPKGLIMLPGEVFQISYTRYAWTNKKFRIKSLTISDDCLIDINADEYDDSFYTGANISKAPVVGTTGLPVVTNISLDPPTGLAATTETSILVGLSWTNSATASPAYTSTEIYGFSPTITSTSINASTELITCASHGLSVGDIVTPFTSVNGLTAGNIYYVISDGFTTGAFKISTTSGGTAVNLTGTTNLSFGKQTFITAVNAPTEYYQDTVYSSSSTSKRYRIRHRIAVDGAVQYSAYTSTVSATVTGISADVTVTQVDIGTGDQSVHIGTSNSFKVWAGAAVPEGAPLTIDENGTLVTRKFEQRSSTGELHWSSSAGFTDAGLNQLLRSIDATLPTTSVNTATVTNRSTVPSGDISSYGEFILGGDSTVSLLCEFTSNGAAIGSDTFASFDLKLYERYSSDGITWGAWAQVGNTVTMNKVTSLTTITSTSVNSTTDTFTKTSHGLVVGQAVVATSGITGGLTAGTTYWVKTAPTTSTFTLSSTPDLATTVNLTDTVNTTFTPNNQFLVTSTSSPYWDGDSWTTTGSYTVAPTTMYLAVGNTSKVQGYYQYGVMGANAAPWASLTTLVKATDGDSIPSFALQDVGTDSVNFIYPLGMYSGIEIYCTSSLTQDLTVTADLVVLNTTANLPRTVRNFPATVLDTGNTGLNGIDTGSIAANTWYDIYMISNGVTDGLICCIAGNSPDMPSGYSYKKLIGAFVTDTNAWVTPFRQYNNKAHFIQTSGNPLKTYSTTGGTSGLTGSGTWTSVSLTVRGVYIPSNSSSLIFNISGGGGTIAVSPSSGTLYDGRASTTNPPPFWTNSASPMTGEMFLEGDDIGYGRTDGFIRFIGYTLKI